MEKENKFKLKLSKIFTSSCKAQDISEVIDHTNNKKPIFTPQNTIYLHTPLIELPQQHEQDYENDPFTPVIKHNHHHNNKHTPSSSSSYSSTSRRRMYCKPRCPETVDHMIRENCIIATAGNNPFPSRKIAGKYSLLSPAAEVSGGGRRCPPASPASPLFSEKQGKMRNMKKKKKRNKGKGTNFEGALFNNLKKNGNPNHQFSYSSSNETDDDIGDWFSSDDEREQDERETLFSLKSVSFSSKSISFSSDSDQIYQARVRNRARPRTRTRKRKPSSRPRKVEEEDEEEVGVMSLKGKVKDTFAVVKSSSDPYNDFRTSMVEMIIEKQIFGAKELEQLLKCFLSLNSPHHHKVIVQVFTEIWDALFSHCS